jgi:hypothetical protein
VVAALGCREAAESPTAPEPGPALDITPAQALSFRQVRAGVVHTCAITPFDVAFCWGYYNWGQLGDGTTTQRLTPVRVLGELHWRQLSGGGGQTCGVTTEDRDTAGGSR